MQSQLHAQEYEYYLQKIQDKENVTPIKERAVKRFRFDSPSENISPCSYQTKIIGSILNSPKYNNNSMKQKEMYLLTYI